MLGQLVSTNYLDIARITLKSQYDHFALENVLDKVDFADYVTGCFTGTEMPRANTKGNLNFVSLTSDQFFCFQNILAIHKLLKRHGLNYVLIAITVRQSAKLYRQKTVV